MKLLSVIIPVYKVSGTLNRCVESVVGQSYRELDIILVDDGSPDDCPALCDQWAQRDSRITVVHQANGGLSAARNTGLSKAKGELVTFVDSDDWLQPSTYAEVIAEMGDAHIVEYSYERGGHIFHLPHSTYHDMGQYWLKGQAYRHAFAWNKIYRRELFSEVRFPEGRVFEDMATLPLLLQRCPCMTTTPKGYYHYTLNSEGITAKATGPQLAMLLNAHLYALTLWADDNYYMHVVNIQLDVARLLGVPPVLPHRKVKPWSLPLASFLKALVINTVGITTLCKVHKLLCRR